MIPFVLDSSRGSAAFKAFDSIRSAMLDKERGGQTYCSWSVLGKPVCRRAWKEIHGVGS